ncbi:unnamed protein product [Rotaria magnacalcarata]|uniref:Carboxymuconolactone decarboxylase-like domain-containing protein n=1 Tax=Rotaria magnacalcarata TaxID=392030 RepID=A0A8S2L9R4_9BILA|nr:unnamed protein product [Rotaria magnacalcarata]
MSLPLVSPLPSNANDKVAELATFFNETLGFCPNSVLTMQHRPAIATAFIQLNKAVMNNQGRVTSALKRLIGYVSSSKTGCQYCQAHTILAAERYGATTEQLAYICQYSTHPAFSAAERAALDFAVAASTAPNAVNSDFLSKLTQLTLFNIQEMTLKPFARLRHLKISECSTKELSRICSELPMLKSLDVCLQGDSITMLDISQLSALTQLRLKIDGWKNKSLLTNLVKDFLPHLVQLKHFELESDLWNSMDDGTRWANLTKSLVTFNFKFKIRFLLKNLNSFRTPFWLEEKQWFVVYFNGDLCTIPRFAPVKYNTNGQSFDMSNLSSNTILHQHITELTVLTEIFHPNQYFPNIEILKMNCSVRMERMFNAISLNNIKHLILSSSSSMAMVLLILPVMPLLDELTIAGRLVPVLIEHLQDNIIEQIRTLNLHFCYFEKESITKMLCQYFPRIKYLNVSLINSTNDIILFIQQLPYLVNASFGMNSLLKKEKEKNCKRLKMTIDKKYSCQIVHSSNQNTFSFVHIWLTDDVSFITRFLDLKEYIYINFSNLYCHSSKQYNDMFKKI